MKRRCPHCGLDTVRRIRRKGRLDFLLTMMGVWPFRCQHCAYRFRRLTPAARFTKTDRREYERLPTEIGATISGKPSGECDQIVDLSMGGCRIKTQMALPPSALLHLQLALPDRERVVTVQTAMVVLRALGRLRGAVPPYGTQGVPVPQPVRPAPLAHSIGRWADGRTILNGGIGRLRVGARRFPLSSSP